MASGKDFRNIFRNTLDQIGFNVIVDQSHREATVAQIAERLNAAHDR